MTGLPDRNSIGLERAFELCARRVGTQTEYVRIGGRRVALEFAGTELAPLLMPAFSHVGAPSGTPELTISVADSESTGVHPKLEPRSNTTQRPRTDAPRPNYLSDGETIHLLDAPRRRAFSWLSSPRALKPWDLAGPFRILISWWAQHLGAQLAHGSVVGREDGAVLFAGPGGSGKSTLTLACLARGLLTAGDDYVWIDARSSEAFSLYSTVKIERGALDRFRSFAHAVRENEGKKAALYLSRVPGALATRLPLRAVAALRVHAATQARVRGASAIEVLAALAPSSLLQLPGSGPRGLARLARLVRETRALSFEAGSDYAANAEAVVRLLDELTAPREQFPRESVL